MSTKTERAAWSATQRSIGLGLDARQLSANIAEAVLEQVWANAKDMYWSSDLTHSACSDGGCNVCILGDIAAILCRPNWAAEVQPATKEPQT